MNKPNYIHLILTWCLALIFLLIGFLVMAPTEHVAAAATNQSNITDTCQNCHATQVATWSSSKHASGNVNCLVCHKLGSGEGQHPQIKYTIEDEATTCQVCHTEVAGENIAGQLALSKHGQVGLKCTTCHEPHSQGPVLSPGSKIVCENCHKEQMQDMVGSTHAAAGLNCINCHMGTSRSHTLVVAGSTCGDCHQNLHKANRIVSSGIKIEPLATPMDVSAIGIEPTETPVPTPAGGIHLPSVLLLLGGLLIGSIGSWAIFAKEPGQPTK